MSKRAVIYCRFSPRPGAELCKSNEHQEFRCKRHCKATGMEVVTICHDNAVSGKLLDRPGLAKAIDDLEPGMVLVVDTCDRLARDMLVSLTIRHQVDKAGCTIEFADGSPSATTPEGELFQNILAAFASYERARIARRTSEGLKRKQANGEHVGRAPVGYRVDDMKLVEDAVEQDAIQIINRLAAFGDTSASIAHTLLRRGLSFRGKPWSARTIRRIISGN